MSGNGTNGMNPSETTVLVTGASGFIALHCVLQLLEQGYRVRGTLRTPSREASLRGALEPHVQAGDRLEFVKADLSSDEGWAEACRGCTYVLHVASPFPKENPKHEDELIVPARDGALRVLRAASEAGVKRVVMTSSLAAVAYGHQKNGTKTLDENDWSNLDGPSIGAYQKSKTIAERAAWDFVNALPEGKKVELAVINPGLVLGPILDSDSGTSGEVVRKLMARELPAVPRLGWACVDVRDVAAMHIKAMTLPEAAGQRFCLALGHYWMQDIAKVLAERFNGRGFKVPTAQLPDVLVRGVGLFDKSIRMVLPSLGKREDISNAKAKRVLGWQPRTMEEMVTAMGESLVAQGVVKGK